MIFTIKNADFSASNIGTLSSWRIVKSLKGVTTTSNVTNVNKDASYSAVFNVSEGYVFNNATVTMGGSNISSSLVWNDDNTIGTLTIDSVTGNVYISIVADSIIDDGGDTVKQYTITYNYVTASGEILKVSTIEKVDEGTIKNFSIENAPEVEGYKIKEVSPASATINEDIIVSYIYEDIAISDDEDPTVETWYFECTDVLALDNKVAASYAGFAYNDPNVLAAYINKPINEFRFAVAQEGVFTYGKTDGTTYTELGTLQLTNVSTTVQKFELPETIRLVAGERLWFGKPTDTGLFYYDAGGGASCEAAKFDVKVTSTQPGGQANTASDALGIDIGYDPIINLVPVETVWYVDTSEITRDRSANPAVAGFSYVATPYVGHPVNVIRLEASKAGTLSYGKTDGTTYTELGSIDITSVSTELQEFKIPEITLNEGERLWFMKPSDTAEFRYVRTTAGTVDDYVFDMRITNDNPTGISNVTSDALCIDIGYVVYEGVEYPVTGISFKEETIDVVIGNSLQLEPIIEPIYATNKKINWSASNSNCSVTSTGLVYAVNNGECVITATTDDGEFTASCTVNVSNTVWYQAVADTSKINTGSTTSTASFMYANSEEVAAYVGKPINLLRLAVHTEGTLSYGKTDGTTYSQLGTIDLVNPSTLLQIYDIPEITLAEGENLWFQGKEDTGKFYYCSSSGTIGKFKYNVNQENPSGTNTSSSNLSIDIGYTNSYDGTINVTGVELDKTGLTMSMGDSIRLNAIIYPQNATNQNVTWTASNSNCTVVDGLVTRVAEGDCTITVTTEDGEFTASCIVTTGDDIWYVNVAGLSSLKNASAVGSCSFVYYDNVTENAINEPINIVRLAVARAGNLSYGKVSNNTKIEIGEITLANPSKELQIYEIPRLILAEGERLWFQNTGDRGLFYYQYDNSNGVGNFYNNVKIGSNVGSTNNRNLSIDVGYDGTIYDENVVTGITLNETGKVMSVNETLTLTATLLPQNAINQNIIWTASNSNCTVVNGLVTTVAAGECTITATSVDGGFTAACNLVILDDETTEVWYVNHADQIDKTHKSLATAASFAYSADRVINACIGKPINAIRLAVAQAGAFAYGKVSEAEYIQLGTIELVNPSTDLQTYIISEITLAKGERLWVQGPSDVGLFWYAPAGSTVIKEATFNMRIKDSDKVGVVGSGSLPIDIGYIDLNKVSITGLEFNSEFLILDSIGSSKQLEAKITPNYATGNITWSASNSNCTVVDGLVTRVAEGDCIITATTEDNAFTASCRVSSVASATWYVDMTSSSTLASTSNNTGGFAYTQDAINSACIGNPINLLRLAVGTEGIFSYGKTDGTTYTLLGTLNFTNPSTQLQVFEIPEVTLAEGEKLVFAQSTDKGYFRYQGPTVANGNFINNVSASKPAGKSEYKGNLSIDIGYLNPNIN